MSDPGTAFALARPAAVAVVSLVAFASGLFLLERRRPLRARTRALPPRLWVNGVLSASAMATAGLAVRPVAVTLLGWTAAERFGLIAAARLPRVAGWVAAFLLLDLSFYYWHRANHRWPLLWRFHNVHHVDPDLDVSTALRFHFGEVALSAGFRAVQVLLIGPPAAAYVAYEVVFQANTLFHHSNARLPLAVERALNRLLVTPRMHGIHHSQVKGETNSNYSVVFPWWDRLHRSLVLGIRQRDIAIGVPGYARPGDNGLAALALLPFRKQRDYWGEQARPARTASPGAATGMLE
ncbi:MAG TPA: sterol desaturase family protein [Vicinamibacteria bacterium]|nr:sterol desaturase family protein [Vicinamibacteria bacterium]